MYSVLKFSAVSVCFIFSLTGMAVPVTTYAEGITPAVCYAITNKGDRDRCVLRYQSQEVRKLQADTARGEAEKEALFRQRQEQLSSQRGYGMPRMEKYSRYKLKVIFDPVLRGQRVKCIGYDAQGDYVYSRSFYLRPPADHGLMKTRDVAKITKIICK